MRALVLQLGILGASFSATFAACGGIAVLDAPTGGGGTGTSSSTSSSTSSGTPDPGTLCAQECVVQTQFCGAPASCEADCLTLFGVGCDAEITALLDCTISASDTSCDFEVCHQELVAYAACSQPLTCQEAMCWAGESGCGCDAICNGTSYSTDCEGDVCTCIQDGETLGTCSPGLCDPESGCCAELFF